MRTPPRMARAVCALALTLLSVVTVDLARADDQTAGDAGDGRGPLAIHEISVGHSSKGPTLKIVFERRLRPSTWDGEYVVAELEGGERQLIRFYFEGGPEGMNSFAWYPYQEHTSWGGYEWSRGPRSIQVTLTSSMVWVEPPDPGGFRFRAISHAKGGSSCARECLDVAPNGAPLTHDYAPPVVERFEVPELSMTSGPTPAVPVTWRVSDRGFSGVRNSRLLVRERGDSEWAEVASHSGSQEVTTEIAREEGAAVELMVEATDRAGHRAESHVLRTTVPFDDGSDAGGGVFTGVWTERAHGDAYLGTEHVSSSPFDTFRFSGSGRRYCIVYRSAPGFGAAELTVGGQSRGVWMNGSPEGSKFPLCVTFEAASERTAELRWKTGDPINVDGYFVD